MLPLASLVGHWMVPPAMTRRRRAGRPTGAPSIARPRRRTGWARSARCHARRARPPRCSRPLPSALESGDDRAGAVRGLRRDALGRRRRVLTVRNGAIRSGSRRAGPSANRLAGRRSPTIAPAPRARRCSTIAKDSLAGPGRRSFLELGGDASRPGAPRYRITAGKAPGMRVSLVAPARDARVGAPGGPLLGPLPPGARVDWELSPAAGWPGSRPSPRGASRCARIIDGELVWLVDGYVPAAAFPLSPRLEWRGRRIGSLRAGFVGTVAAETGMTRIFLRPGSDASATRGPRSPKEWSSRRPRSPRACSRALPYPVELFRVQSRRSSGPAGSSGRAAGAPAPNATSPARRLAWAPDTTGPAARDRVRAGHRPPGQRAARGESRGGQRRAAARRASIPPRALPSRAALESRWSRFPSFDALSDSIRDDGGRLERGPVRFDLTPDGRRCLPVTLRPPGRRRDRRGVGQRRHRSENGRRANFAEAWSNLLGASVPPVAGRRRLPGWRRPDASCCGPTRALRVGRLGRRSAGPGNRCARPSESPPNRDAR